MFNMRGSRAQCSSVPLECRSMIQTSGAGLAGLGLEGVVSLPTFACFYPQLVKCDATCLEESRDSSE